MKSMNIENKNIKKILFKNNYNINKSGGGENENNNKNKELNENNNEELNENNNEELNENNNEELNENNNEELNKNNNEELNENNNEELNENNNEELNENNNQSNEMIIINKTKGNNTQDQENNEVIEFENDINDNKNNNSIKTIKFSNTGYNSNNTNNNIENITFNNLGENNITKIFTENQNIVINEEVAIKNENLIYKDDIVYIKELENQLLSEYPVTRQQTKFIEKEVMETAKKIIEVKNIGVKINNMTKNNIEYSLINDIINDNFSTSNFIIPIVLDKHRIYTKLKEEDKKTEENSGESSNIYFSESLENPDTIHEENQKIQMNTLKKLEHEYNLSKINFKKYLNDIKNIINPYYPIYSEKDNFQNIGFKVNPNNKTLVLRYSDFKNINWTTYQNNEKYSYSKDVLDEKGKIKGLEENILVKSDEINVVGFMIISNDDKISINKNNILFPNSYSNFLDKVFIKIGNITKIFNSGESIIIDIKNHNLNDNDTIYIENSNSFPRINYTFSKSVKIVDNDKISIKTNIKLLKEGNEGILYSLKKLKYDLYEIKKNNDNIEINLKETNYKESEKNDHNKIYLFNSQIIDKNDYDKIIKKIMPTVNDIINKEQEKINNSYTFNDINLIIKKYNFTIDDINIKDSIKIKDILQYNLNKIINQKSQKNIKLNFNKNTKKFFNDNNYFLSNYFIDDINIKKIYSIYENFNKPEDNTILRLKWLEKQKDNGKLFYLYSLIKNYNNFKDTYNIKYIKSKLDELKILHNELEKNLSKQKNINSKNKLKVYKYQAYIVTEKDEEDNFKNLKNILLDNTVIFYKDNLYLWKDGKKKEFTDIDENTMALVENSIWIWENKKWYKTDSSSKYENIRYLCELNNLDLKNIQLDSLQSVYRKDYGCATKLHVRLDDAYNKIKNDLENFNILEKYIKNDEYITEINKKIEILKKDFFNNTSIEIKNIEAIENRENTENKNNLKNIKYNDNLSLLLKLINNVSNYDLKLEYIYNLIEKDGLLINNDIYSKKYKRKFNICGHYYYFKKINYANSPDVKTQLIDDMLTLYSDDGEVEKNIHICKNCGEYLMNNEYDDTEGFSSSGAIIKSREIWKTENIKQNVEQKNILEYIKNSNIDITKDEKTFKEFLLKFGLSIDDVEEAVSISTFIIKNLYPKTGVKLPNTELINVIIDSMQKNKSIIPYSLYKIREIKKYKDKGITVQDIEGDTRIKDSYLQYLKLKKTVTISSRFLISIQTTFPAIKRSSKTSICAFNSFDGNDGIDYITCILEEMKIIILRDKTKSFEILKIAFEESYNDFKKLSHIKDLYIKKQEYNSEIKKKQGNLKFKLNNLDENIIVVEELDKNYEKDLKESKSAQLIYKYKNELYKRLNYLGSYIKKTVKDYISSAEITDIYSGLVESSCCTEYADQFLNYYFQIELDSNIPLKKYIDESNEIFNFTKYFVNIGSIHKFILIDKTKFDGIYNSAIVDDEINTSENLIKAIFELYVDTGIHKGTLREYSGSINNLIDIKSGLTKKQILEKQYTINQYKELLKNIESHNIKYYEKFEITEFTKNQLENFKKMSEIEKINKEIEKLIKNMANILSKDKEFIIKYTKILRNFGVTINNNSNKTNKSEILRTKVKNDKYKDKSRLEYSKNFYVTKIRKYLSIIKNGKNSSENMHEIKFVNDDDILLELQKEIYSQNQKFEKFLNNEIKSYFYDLNPEYTNNEIYSINGIDDIYNSKFDKIKIYSDFNFNDAANVVFYIILSELNKFIYCDIADSKKKILKTDFYSDKDLYDVNIKNKKCKYICEFIMILFDEIEEDQRIFNDCINGSTMIENSLIHDVIEYKSKLFDKQDDDDFFTKQLKRLLSGKKIVTEEEVIIDDDSPIIDNEEYNPDEEDKLDMILETGKKVLSEKLGYNPTDDQLETYKEDYIKNMEDDIMYEEEIYDLNSTSKGKEVLDQGADYGDFNEYDFETGDGFDYSQEEYVE